jgi:hypothetical protein
MWYAPIIPWLKHLFWYKEHAKLFRCHKEDHLSDEMLRHPADGSQWRKIDREFEDFVGDTRNLRFGLSTDGFNPFGEQSSSHSTWPVTLCIYNLPPWLCMKWKFIMMPVLIQGPRQPGNSIDVYLRPLFDELLHSCGPILVYVCGISTNKSNLTYERCCSSASIIGLILETFQDRQTRDTMHARTI